MTAISPQLQQSLLTGPAATPPPGIESSFGDPHPWVPAVIANGVVEHTVVTTCVLLRVYTQHFLSGGFVTEDWIIVIAAALHIALDVVGALCIKEGVHKHMWDIKLATFVALMERVYAYGIIYFICTCLIKTAILLQLIRVFATYHMNRNTWFACWSTIIVIILFTIINVCLIIFQCWPIEGAWNVFKAGHCLSLERIYKSSCIFNVISDFAILLVPIPVIFKLNMTSRRRLAVAAVFATGAFACVASILRLYYTLRIFDTMDVSYYLGPMGVVSTIEQSIGILIFCMPKLHQFFHYMRITTRKSTAAASLLSPDSSAELVKRETADKANKGLYDMPSLASFEERALLSKNASAASDINSMPSLDSE